MKGWTLEAIEGKKAKHKGNQKVLNARRVKAYGLTFESQLELFAYESFTHAKIPFRFQWPKNTIHPAFKYAGKRVPAMTQTYDFFLPEHDIFVDTKGHTTRVFIEKSKMLRFMWKGTGKETPILILKTKTNVSAFVAMIKSGKLSEAKEIFEL